MSNTLQNLPFFNAVGGGVASLNLTLGMTYDRIILKITGDRLAGADGLLDNTDIDSIKCKLNGKTFYEITGAALLSLNKYKGISTDANFLTIDFTEPNNRTAAGEKLGGIVTAQGIDSFTLEVKMKSAVSVTLESWSQVSPAKAGRHPVMSMVHHPVSFSSGGKFPVQLPYSRGSAPDIKRVNIFHANLTSIEVKKNSVAVYEDIPTPVAEYFQKEYGRVPQAGLAVFDAIVTNNWREMLATRDAKSLQVNATISAADTLNIYVESLVMLDAI